jgi:hypothetical protein
MLSKPTGAGAVENWGLDINKLLQRGNAVYVPDNPVVRAELLQVNYNDFLKGYFGISKTLKIL